jgi:hypothetical protein
MDRVAALEYYITDLPKAAGVGNILLANNQARILHDMFLPDIEILSPGFASALNNVIANQFALNAFYDVVQRHNEGLPPATGRSHSRSMRPSASSAQSRTTRRAGLGLKSKRGYAKWRRPSRPSSWCSPSRHPTTTAAARNA